ncbi:MAG: LysR family transcriptional regulator [Gammaproteobacteria bacterium]|nr:LysR family transcriptional regulator [Gammaproteobacteria bacterium]NNJ96897.1 LysR family transcriptional regulator [Gammaproteobacteria bacterium]
MQQYDLVALRAFVTVVEAGGFNRAAEQLEASAAAVSRRISGLESALGVKLLNRTTRQIDLTESGRQFYADVVNIFESLAEAEDKIQTRRGTIKGNLRLAAPLSFGVGRIAPILPVFMKRHPELKVHLQLEDRFTDLVAEGVDVAIRIGALKDSTLVATRLASIPRVFCASPEYLALKGEPTRPEELASHHCLHYSLLSTRDNWNFSTRNKARDIVINGPLTTNNGDVLKEAAIQGMGIAMMPTFIVEDALNDGRLQKILNAYCPEPFGLYAVRPSRRFTPAKVRALIEYLKMQFDDGLLNANA